MINNVFMESCQRSENKTSTTIDRHFAVILWNGCFWSVSAYFNGLQVFSEDISLPIPMLVGGKNHQQNSNRCIACSHCNPVQPAWRATENLKIPPTYPESPISTSRHYTATTINTNLKLETLKASTSCTSCTEFRSAPCGLNLHPWLLWLHFEPLSNRTTRKCNAVFVTVWSSSVYPPSSPN